MSSLRQHHRRHPRVLSRPVNSGRCEHHQRAAGTFNGFTRHLSCTIAPVFTRFYSPASSSLSRTVHLRSRHSFFLLLIALSSSSTRHLICRPPFRIFSFLVVPISFDFFPALLHHVSPISLPASCPTVICPWQEKDSRSQEYAARVAYFSVRECQRSNERVNERAGGWSDCMRHEKNRPRKIGM